VATKEGRKANGKESKIVTQKTDPKIPGSVFSSEIHRAKEDFSKGWSEGTEGCENSPLLRCS
jgi:hypothetical protein